MSPGPILAVDFESYAKPSCFSRHHLSAISGVGRVIFNQTFFVMAAYFAQPEWYFLFAANSCQWQF